MIPLSDANLARLDLMSFFLGCFTMGAGLIFMVGIASLIGRIIYRMREGVNPNERRNG